MKMHSRQLSKNCVAGFTIVELMIATTILSFVGIVFVSLIKFSGYSMLDISQQTEFNRSASNTTFQIIQRTRYSHTFLVTDSGNILTLIFDDNAEVDTDGDGDFYNDDDHQETFQYVASDTTVTNSIGTDTTLTAESISHLSAADSTPRTLITNVLPIGTLAIFEEATTRQVDIHFRLYNQLANNPRTQKIEISTSAYRVNGIDI